MTDTSTQETTVANRVISLFRDARQARRHRVEFWDRSYKMVHNRGWSPLRESWMPSPQASEIYPICASMVGWMTDQRPTLNVTASLDPHSPTAEFMQQLARDLEKTLQASWIVNNTDAEVEKVVWDAMIYGTGFFKANWDQSLSGGLGDACLVRVDPYKLYPDPQATSLDDANYIIEASTMSLQEVERRYPGKSDLVRDSAGLVDSQLDERDDRLNGSKFPKANPGGVAGGPPVWGAPGDAKEHVIYDEGVTVYEAWIRENDSYEDDDGELVVEDRWKVIVVAGNVVLLEADVEQELFSHGKHPYVRYVLNDLGEFWGISLVEHLTPLQISINRLLAAMQSHAELVGNPVLMEDTRSGIQRTQIVNKPGQRVTKNPGTEVDWLRPPEMSRDVMNLVAFYVGEMERVSGLSAIVRGATPTGRNSQGVMDAVQESAFVRVRLALRNLERALRSAGELLASLIAENYTAPRIVSIVGPEGQNSAMTLNSRHFYLRTPDGETPLKFSLWVQAGSTLPISRQARAAEADTLFAMGAIDRMALLEAHDYPNRQQITARMAEMDAAGVSQAPGARQAAGRTT